MWSFNIPERLWRNQKRTFSRGVSILALAISAVAPGNIVFSTEKEELTIWAGRYTPSRTMAAVGSGIKGRDIKGIDPIIEAYQELHPNVQINVLGPINKLRYQTVDSLILQPKQLRKLCGI